MLRLVSLPQMNTFNLVLVLFCLCASFTTLVSADTHIGYWYKDRSCDPSKANGMYVQRLGDPYPVDAGAVYLVRPGTLVASKRDCISDGNPTKIYSCQAFRPPKRITCVKNTG